MNIQELINDSQTTIVDVRTEEEFTEFTIEMSFAKGKLHEDEDDNDSYDENEEIENKNAFINFHKMISNLSEADRNSKVIKDMINDITEKET